ncbi:hypothetical protein KUTeg_022950 [Tegillarca granosa]|uniref:Uncharacterized protein n=1 Tax=Tegillarca granosa TaxID=220873 RepID=A0ABQ9E5W0_TEGGR|nr:hypothetical protein KUTeg_022950 [Tegillarca granosa]
MPSVTYKIYKSITHPIEKDKLSKVHFSFHTFTLKAICLLIDIWAFYDRRMYFLFLTGPHWSISLSNKRKELREIDNIVKKSFCGSMVKEVYLLEVAISGKTSYLFICLDSNFNDKVKTVEQRGVWIKVKFALFSDLIQNKLIQDGMMLI